MSGSSAPPLRRAPGPADAVEGAGVEMHGRADLRDRDAGLAPLPDDHPLLRLEVDEADEIRGVGTEQPRDLFGHDVEDRFRPLGLRDGDRNAAQCRASLGECLERLLLELLRGDVADDRDRLVVAAPDDARLEVSQRVVLPLQRVVDDLDGVVLERALHRDEHGVGGLGRQDRRGRSCRRVSRSRPGAARSRRAGTRGTSRPRRRGTCCRASPRGARRRDVRLPRASEATARARARSARRRAPRRARADPEGTRRARPRAPRRRGWRRGRRPPSGARAAGRRRRRTRARRSRGSRARGSGRGARGGARPGPPRACASPTARRRAAGSSRRSAERRSP